MNKVIAVSIFTVLIIGLSTSPVFADLNKATLSNLRIVDNFGNPVYSPLQAGKQVQFVADLTNNQKIEQPFAFVVQVKNGAGVQVSISWITGSLLAGQTLSPAQSWTPTYSGKYTVQIHALKSIDSPSQLSNPSSLKFKVHGPKHTFDTVSVALSGSVKPPFHNHNAMLLIFDPSGNLLQIVHAPVANDGTYDVNLTAGGPLYKIKGAYNVLVYYYGIKQTSLSFHCTPGSPLSCSVP